MQRLNNTITKREISHLLNLRVTHHKASISILEALSFKNSKQASDEISKILNVKENLILQTCNRIEIFLAVSTEDISSIEENVSLPQQINDKRDLYFVKLQVFLMLFFECTSRSYLLRKQYFSIRFFLF